MTKEDVGTYYCGIINSQDVVFGSGTVLELEGDSKPVQTELQSPDYIRVQPGDSVTLTCSFNTSFCSEQTSVTWIKSGLTTEIIAQSSGIKNIVCGNTDGTSCVHNLTLKDVSSAEDGTYFCVVSACGHSLTGARIQVNGQPDLSPTVLVLTVLNVVFFAAVVVLVSLVHSYRKNQQTEVHRLGSALGEQAEDEVTYAGVNVVPRSASNRSTSVTPRHDAVVYSESPPAHTSSDFQKQLVRMVMLNAVLMSVLWTLCTVLELEGDTNLFRLSSRSSGIKNIVCGNTDGTSCVHNLTLKDVSSAEDGTYFCVVSACGHSLTGTRIHVYGDRAHSEQSELSPMMLFSIVLNIVFFAAVVVLVCLVLSYRKNQQTEVHCLGSALGEQTEDEITYAGVNVVPRSASNRSTSATPRHDAVVYSEVKNQHNEPSNRSKRS
ncbi:hypothetical protein WMY93_017259 [Mugilogobius chulae]|uniref:Ig-like domain-containing protein n=1 Tax=Mugilogobius chulae TaxID=88201 RepID=A0AAW0NYR8_9GOBI